MPGDEIRNAYWRAKADAEDRAFFLYPGDVAMFETDRDAQLEAIERQCDSGAYAGGAWVQVEQPKAGWHSRPSVAISFKDQVAYAYLAMKAAEVIRPRMEWSARTVRFSYRLAGVGRKWFIDDYTGWSQFRKVSIAKLESTGGYLISADIAGYYENIDIGKLVQAVRDAGVQETVTRQLSGLWNKWAGIRSRGIPQGLAPSHVFGEFFLDSVDEWLRSNGLDHLRYLDDFRIFASTLAKARDALQELSRVLRERGLNLQTAKTDIWDAADARMRLSEVESTLRRVSAKMAHELIAFEGEYADPDEIRRLLEQDPSTPSPDVVENAWESFEKGDFGPFDKTVFHYLLRRLAKQRSARAIPYCLTQLHDRPEETKEVLEYITDTDHETSPPTLDALATIVETRTNPFPLQRCWVLRWFLGRAEANPRVLVASRALLPGADGDLLKVWAIAYLGKHSHEATDFDLLSRRLVHDADPRMRATLLWALRRAPSGLRNMHFSRFAGEDELVDLAIRLGRAG